MGAVDPERLVCDEECGTHTSTTRRRARGARIPRPRGRCRAWGRCRPRRPVTTLLAGPSLARMSPAMTVEGGTTAAGFAAYLHRILVPALHPGQTVVVDDVGRTNPSGCTS